MIFLKNQFFYDVIIQFQKFFHSQVKIITGSLMVFDGMRCMDERLQQKEYRVKSGQYFFLIRIKKSQVKILTPLLVYIFIRATRWDHSQSSRIEKTSIFQFFLKNRFFKNRFFQSIFKNRVQELKNDQIYRFFKNFLKIDEKIV